MVEVIIYTKHYCSYCVRAKNLLNKKGVKYTEIDVEDDEKREEMIEKSNGARTVPQIFINKKHIGGCDDLYELEREGLLDDMLKN